MNYVTRKYKEFYDKKGYIPKYFYVYNCCEINGIHPALITQCGRPDKTGCVLILEKENEDVTLLQKKID